MACPPQLGIGDVDQAPPLLFTSCIRRLEVDEQELLLTEAEKVFQVVALPISTIDLDQTQLLSTLADDELASRFDRMPGIRSEPPTKERRISRRRNRRGELMIDAGQSK